MTKTEQMRLIQDEILALEVSPLFEYRLANKFQPVIGEGSLDSNIMFVGEAPGRNEAKSGKPFCGAAGKILDRLLSHVKISRKSIYITNIIKDRPPENRDPTPKEIEVYGPYLDKQIAIIKPRIIVALGRFSMKYLMKKFGLESFIEPIGKAHGKVYKVIDGDSESTSQIIVALYHPCVGIYNSKKIPMMKKDMEILQLLNAEYI